MRYRGRVLATLLALPGLLAAKPNQKADDTLPSHMWFHSQEGDNTTRVILQTSASACRAKIHALTTSARRRYPESIGYIVGTENGFNVIGPDTKYGFVRSISYSCESNVMSRVEHTMTVEHGEVPALVTPPPLLSPIIDANPVHGN
jgi:hypothetical protein